MAAKKRKTNDVHPKQRSQTKGSRVTKQTGRQFKRENKKTSRRLKKKGWLF